MKIEVCIDSVESALTAQEAGADRVELCQNLFEGGTTPSSGMIQQVRSRVSLGVQVIIRPRGGDFLYSDLEYEVMKDDILRAKSLGADGIVLGLLNADGTVDRDRTAALIELSRPLNITFHRAFDMTRDLFEALETLIELGVERVLTSGAEPTVWDGVDTVRELVQRAGDRIIILPGGGIHERNVEKIVAATGVKEIHASASHTISSDMNFTNNHCFMGKALRPAEYGRSVASLDRLNFYLKTLKK